METKTCNKCGKQLLLEEFYAQRQISPKGRVCNYRDSYCKRCRSEYSSERRKQIKRQCVAYLGGQCKRCGLKTERVEVYDFHHPDPTVKEISIGKQTRSFKGLQAELDKCDLLCANCHRLEHGE